MSKTARGMIIGCGRDEYPGTGYRLQIDGREYETDLLEEMIGRTNLQIGDEVEVSCRVVSRVVTERRRFPVERPAHLSTCGTQFRGCAPGTPSPLIAATPSSPSTTLWTVGTQTGVSNTQLTEVAQAIEEAIQQDLTGTLHENKVIGINADGARPAFDVVMDVSGDTEVSIKVGLQAVFSIGKAASLAALIRSIPGHGSTYIPS